MTRFIDQTLTHEDAVALARTHIERGALHESPDVPRQVGLELEFHLVNLGCPAERPSWEAVTGLLESLPPMPSGSSVTCEPGGQIELSTPPAVGVAASVAALQADRDALRTALHAAGYGAAPIGADPARVPARVNPNPRYAAMQRHFDAVGCLDHGTAMMTATAALQVNLDAGPVAGWTERMHLAHALGPVLVAVSANSPYLGGRASGWASMRQEAWHGIDHGRSDPVEGADPAVAWADYALRAPVMLVRGEDGSAAPLTERVSFEAWLRGDAPIARRPDEADLDYHLTTLFPPVRPRGYVEVRCIDALPDAWWPALAAFTATLLDAPAAAKAAAVALRPVRNAWLAAAHEGLRDPAVLSAARTCTALAVEHADPASRPALDRLAELVDSGRSPGDELRRRIDAAGPLTVLGEEARA